MVIFHTFDDANSMERPSPFPRATCCGAHRVSQGGFFADAYGSTQGFLQAQLFFGDSTGVNTGGSFEHMTWQ